VASAGPYAICTSLQTDNHASTPPLSFLQAGCPSCHPTNSVKALKAVLDILDILSFISLFSCPYLGAHAGGELKAIIYLIHIILTWVPPNVG